MGTNHTYRYISVPAKPSGQFASGTFTADSSVSVHVALGFKPDYLALTFNTTAGTYIYNKNISITSVIRCVYNGISTVSIPRTSSLTNNFASIDSDGFTVGPQSYKNGVYFAYAE